MSFTRSLASPLLAVLVLAGCPGPKPTPVLPEDPLGDATVSLSYSHRITATGGTGSLAYEATSLPPGLRMDAGGIISGTPTAPGEFNVEVKVTDAEKQSATRAYPLKVYPALAFRDTGVPDAVVGAPYTANLPVIGGKAPLTFVLTTGSLPPGISLNASTGALGGTPPSGGSFSFGVQGQDSNGATANASFTLHVSTALAVTTAELAKANVGTPYSDAIQTAGGRAPIRLSIASGTLPPGLTLSNNGALSGTPTVAGVFNFRAAATDASQRTSNRDLSLRVLANPPPRITTTSLPNAYVGSAYSVTLAGADGGLPYTWTLLAGPLPGGLALSPSGVLSGTPTAAGTFPVQVSLADANGQIATRSLALTVIPKVQITTPALPDAYVGSAYSATLTASGGQAPLTWSLTGGLPPGLGFSSSGILGGTPGAAGSFGLIVEVTDASDQSATRPLSLDVYEQPKISTPVLADGSVGSTYSQILQVSGGKAPFNFTVAVGNLPPGLALSTSGSLAGTPTQAGQFDVTVQATDANGRVASQTYRIYIWTGLAISTGALPDGYTGTAYSQILGAVGGEAPYTWSLSTGALPPGLNLSASGALTGTPTTSGSFSFEVQVTDSTTPTAQTRTKPLILTINAPPAISTTSLEDGYVGSAYSRALAGTGGRTPYTFTLAEGTLPVGLSLTSGGVISGTPTSATTAGPLAFALTDANGVTASKGSLSLTIHPAVIISTTALPDGYLTVAYSAALQGSGGKAPLTWSVAEGTLPPGLSLSPSGALGGTPTASGTYDFTLELADANGKADTKALSIVVAPALQVVTGSLVDGYTGTAYTASLAAAGGKAPYSFSLTTGSLPAGLALAAGGAITGTPTATGTASFTVQVKDANGTLAAKPLTISVYAPVVVTTAAYPDGYVADAYSASTIAAGGKAPYAWSVTNGTLPPGLSLSPSTGALSGTPTATGARTFTVSVADANGVSASRSLTVTVYDLPSVTTSSPLPEGYAGDPYSVALAATGGKGPLSWSLASGALPPGLQLSSAGAIGSTLGAAANGQTYAFSATVADANGKVASKALAITTYIAPTVTNTGLTTATEGITYRKAPGTPEGISALNGKAPLAYAATGLPPGLALDGATGAISGIPAQGSANTYSVTLKITDASGKTHSKTLPLVVQPARPVPYGGTSGVEPAGSPITDVLTVFVVDEAGRPVQGMGVRVRRNGVEYNPVKESLTNADGKVFFTGMGCNGTTDTVDITVNGRNFANATLARVNAALVTMAPPEYPIPLPRYAAAGAYDPKLGAVVMAGGYTDFYYASIRSTCVDDLVRYNASNHTWLEQVPPGMSMAPRARGQAGMAHGGGVDVLFGGEDCADGSYAPLAETWEYDATTNGWTRGGDGPSARIAVAMTANRAGDGVLLFGGYNGGNYLGDLWNYQAATNTWSQVVPLSATPAARAWAGAAYDKFQDAMWVCGGYGATGELPDCAAYLQGPNRWESRPALPQPRSGFGMAYGGVLYLFGGQSDGVDLDDLLYFDRGSNTWKQVAVGTNRPVARWQPTLVYDESSGRLILMGGWSSTYGVLTDTWTYDTTNGWVLRSPSRPPVGVTVTGTIAGKNTNNSFALVTLTSTSGYSNSLSIRLTPNGNAGQPATGSYTFQGVPAGDTYEVVAINEDRTLAYPNRFWSYVSSGPLTAGATGSTDTFNITFPAGPLALTTSTGTFTLPNDWKSAGLFGRPRQQRPGFPVANNGGFSATLSNRSFRFDYFKPTPPVLQSGYIGAQNDDPNACELSYAFWSAGIPSGPLGDVALMIGPRSLSPGQSLCTPAGMGVRSGGVVDSSNEPVGVALGDVNGDGLLDLAVANSASNSVSVAFGEGAGRFAEPGGGNYATVTASVNSPTAVAIADLDGDSKGELLVTNYYPAANGVLTVHEWTSGITFAAPASYTVGGNPAGLTVGELNGDGKLDVVVANYGGNSLTPLLGNGTGGLAAQTAVGMPTGGTGPATVALADVTGDGKADAVVPAFDSNNVWVLAGTGSGSFGTATSLNAGTSPRAVALGDINGDGKRDLVVANQGSNNLFVFTGTGTGFNATPSQVALGGAPLGVAIEELTGDNQKDLAVIVVSTSELRIYRNTGSGFALYDSDPTSANPSALAVGDIVMDGRADIVVACRSNAVPVYVQQRPLPLATEGTYSFSAVGGTRMFWANRGPNQRSIDWEYVSRAAPGTTSFTLPLPSTLAPSRPTPPGQSVGWDVNMYSYPSGSTFNYDNFRWRHVRQDASGFVASQGYSFTRQ